MIFGALIIFIAMILNCDMEKVMSKLEELVAKQEAFAAVIKEATKQQKSEELKAVRRIC